MRGPRETKNLQYKFMGSVIKEQCSFRQPLILKRLVRQIPNAQTGILLLLLLLASTVNVPDATVLYIRG